MGRQKAMILFLIMMTVSAVCFAPKEFAFVTSHKISGIICSDGYTKEFAKLFSKNSHYYYTVEYKVNGRKYISEKYERSNGRLQKGDIVTIHYNPSKPGDIVESTFPIITPSLFLITIIGIISIQNSRENI